MAARQLIERLALAYLEATGCQTPYCVGLESKGPFLNYVLRYFQLMRISAGNVVYLINERGAIRKKMDETPDLDARCIVERGV